MKSILLAFSMFSALPMPRVEWNEKNMRFMMCAFPLVGATITFLYVLSFLFWIQCAYFWQKPVPIYLPALVFTLIPVLITGGIHVDGFMDTCDALASHASREKKLEILKDSHSGAFAVLGCVIYFLSYFVFSLAVSDYFFNPDNSYSHGRFENFFALFMRFFPLTLIFILSRLLSAFAVAVFPIAKDSGLVHTFASASSKKFTYIWCASCFIIISVLLVLFFWEAGIVSVLSCLSVFVFYFFVSKRNFGGITGDTAGWFVQLCEIVTLALSVIFLFL